VLRAARLVIVAGNAGRAREVPGRPAVLRLPSPSAPSGEWYIDPPPASPLSGAFAGVDWNRLPPATGMVEHRPDSGATVVLTARLARRGAPRPALVLRERRGRRVATMLVPGLWRWRFRGGADAIAYRSLVAGLVDWLLATDGDAAERRRFVPVAHVVANGLPLTWRWTAAEPPPGPVAVRLDSLDEQGRGGTVRTDTLRFGAGGEFSTRLAPGVYRYTVLDGSTRRESGLVAVETYSDEWRPQPVALVWQSGQAGPRMVHVSARDRWWIFMLVIVAFVVEWAWRRRQGLP
jgi:hypothetical protein